MRLFGRKKKISDEQFYAPVNGTILPIEEVPDPTFANKLIGDGIAFEPTDGEVVAPVTGEVVQVFPTKHAIGIKSEAGFEVLLHVGIETVAMDGEGFTVSVNPGDKVNTGDKLLTFDLDLVKEKASKATHCVTRLRFSYDLPLACTSHVKHCSRICCTCHDVCNEK